MPSWTSSTGVCFDPEPLPPSKKPAKRGRKGNRDKLPYTAICNAALEIGLSKEDILEMGWGELVLTLQANAREDDSGPREATWKEITAWAGMPM